MLDVLIDANNVRRSRWPNLSPQEIVEACGAWAARSDRRAHVIFDGPAPPAAAGGREACIVVGAGAESADDLIARTAEQWARAGRAYELVTSDRELRERAGAGSVRVVGGGSFLRELLGAPGR